MSVIIILFQYRFEFLKALSSRLVRPNVHPSHEWTGDRVRQISAQGDVYIRTTYALNLDGLPVSWILCNNNNYSFLVVVNSINNRHLRKLQQPVPLGFRTH